MLLGAGASIDAGYPSAAELTRSLLQHAETEASADGSWAVVTEIARALADLNADADFEAIAEWLTVFAHAEEAAAGLVSVSDPALATALRREIRKWASAPPVLALSAIWNYVFERIDRPAGDATYLESLADLAKTEGGFAIGTLNFDTAVERAFEARQIECSTGGVRYGRGHEALTFPPTGAARLYKLHGSVNWPQFGWAAACILNGSDRAPFGPRTVGGSPRSDPGSIVFGPSKLTHSGPFLELYVGLRQEVRNANRLVIVGYSFRDAHVNELIRLFVNLRLGPTVIIDPFFPSGPKNGMLDIHRQLLSASSDEYESVTIVRDTAEAALSDVLRQAT